MKVFVFFKPKDYKSSIFKVQENFDGFLFCPKQSIWGGKKSTSEAQKRSLYVKMFYFQQRLKK